MNSLFFSLLLYVKTTFNYLNVINLKQITAHILQMAKDKSTRVHYRTQENTIKQSLDQGQCRVWWSSQWRLLLGGTLATSHFLWQTLRLHFCNVGRQTFPCSVFQAQVLEQHCFVVLEALQGNNNSRCWAPVLREQIGRRLEPTFSVSGPMSGASLFSGASSTLKSEQQSAVGFSFHT